MAKEQSKGDVAVASVILPDYQRPFMRSCSLEHKGDPQSKGSRSKNYRAFVIMVGPVRSDLSWEVATGQFLRIKSCMDNSPFIGEAGPSSVSHNREVSFVKKVST